MSVAETDYETYALLYTEGVRGPGQDFRMATLYSTCPTPRPPPGLGLRPRGCLGAPRAWEQGQNGDPPDKRRPKAAPHCPGRSQNPRAEVKEHFTTFAKSLGFTEEGIVFLPKTGERTDLKGGD